MSALATFATVGSHCSDHERIRGPVHVLDVVGSTNDFAFARGRDGTVVVADKQLAGRGRMKRPWASAPGLGLWFSVCLDASPQGTPFAAVLAVRDGIGPSNGLRVKWPNDLLVEEKKICGILTEQRGDRTVVGIGLNVLHEPADFPPELRDRATSLAAASQRAWDRAALLAAILKHLDQRVMLLARGGYERIHREWRDACDIVGRWVSTETHAGRVTSVDHEGALIVETEAGPHRIVAGDVAVTQSRPGG